MIVLGRNLIIKVNGTAIAGAKSCEINIQGEDIEVASATQQQWREFMSGRKTWTVSCSHLIPATGTPMRSNAEMVNTRVTLLLQTGLENDILSGQAIVKQWSATGAVGALAKGSFSFQGTGQLD